MLTAPCPQPVVGVRRRCKICSDFDYCFKCFWTAEKTHPGHEFDKIKAGGTGPEQEPQQIEDSEIEDAEMEDAEMGDTETEDTETETSSDKT